MKQRAISLLACSLTLAVSIASARSPAPPPKLPQTLVLKWRADDALLHPSDKPALDRVVEELRQCNAEQLFKGYAHIVSRSKSLTDPRRDYQILGERGEAVYRYIIGAERLESAHVTMIIHALSSYAPDNSASVDDHSVSVTYGCYRL